MSMRVTLIAVVLVLGVQSLAFANCYEFTQQTE
ncbi:hypothetical protein Enr13x_73410 [Stieleria neptunia]|uniref:Uncharacterized protein n=1 Tax=Stieleria neptunia TaxID=2527979 RepID=A0A518I2V7_9BACT|nr:hypothetical protein Enr13x_73410 [Stieleria neptunia]